MNSWQRIAVRWGLVLGLMIFLLNVLLTFIYFDPSVHTILSYTTAPLIIFITGIAGYISMGKTNKITSALMSSVLTVGIGLLIGFSTLFILNFIFMDIVSNNPFTIMNFQNNGEQNIREFIMNYTMNAALQSTIVSLVLSIISGTIGGFIRSKIK